VHFGSERGSREVYWAGDRGAHDRWVLESIELGAHEETSPTGMCERLVALEIDPVVDLQPQPPDRKG
jgi:hypothetical protein